MGVGSKYLYIHNGTISLFPIKVINQILKNNGIMKLDKVAETKGLLVSLMYQIQDKKPHRLLQVNYERIHFNSAGECNYHEVLEAAGITHGINLSPQPSTNPSDTELAILKEYLQNKVPTLTGFQ